MCEGSGKKRRNEAKIRIVVYLLRISAVLVRVRWPTKKKKKKKEKIRVHHCEKERERERWLDVPHMYPYEEISIIAWNDQHIFILFFNFVCASSI